jgi:hypothetical protein
MLVVLQTKVLSIIISLAGLESLITLTALVDLAAIAFWRFVAARAVRFGTKASQQKFFVRSLSGLGHQRHDYESYKQTNMDATSVCLGFWAGSASR